MCAVIDAVSGFAPVRRVNFMYAATVVELEVGYGNGDGRKYLREFLPGIVANRPTSYHRDAVSFLSEVRNHARERTLDPARLFPGPLPQDVTDYINEPNWGILSPGMRVSPGCAADTGARTETVSSTTSGIMLRRGEDCYVTMANHGFSDVQDIFHPAPSGEKIGDVVDRYPELDIAMVRLTPSNSDRYTNRMYFQAATSKRLADVIDMVPGRWFEVDGMSRGLLSLMYCGRSMEKPTRSPGPENPPIPTDQWQQKNLFNIFGGTNPQLLEGICGAPLVEEDTGLVAGFFHLAVGDWAECAVLDDLVAEGWQIV